MTLDIRYGLLALAYTAMIFWLGSQPGLGIDRSDVTTRVIANFFHIPLYAGHGYWILQALSGGTGMAVSPLRRAAATFTITGIVALLDEWHQQFAPGREASPWDLLLDLAGVAGLLLTCALGARATASS